MTVVAVALVEVTAVEVTAVEMVGVVMVVEKEVDTKSFPNHRANFDLI